MDRPENMLKKESLHKDHEEGSQVQGQSGREVAQQAVVGEEDEDDQN